MNTSLDDLDPKFRLKAFELLARCVEARISIRIIETLRSLEQQQENVAAGHSWTIKSKHLIGKAIDIAPVHVLAVKNWDPDDPSWKIIGEIGEHLGLVWGGRWKIPDCPHFEEIA